MHKPRLLILFFILFLSNNLSAQKNETVYDKPGTKISGILAPTINYLTLDGQENISIGARMGVLVAQRLILGAYGQLNPGSFNRTTYANQREYQLREGGLWLGYQFSPHKIVHPSVHLNLGYAYPELINNASQPDNLGDFFVIEPKFEMVLSAVNVLKISAGIGYRYAIEMEDSAIYYGSDFSGPSVSLNLNFGYFD